jgi:hypothetical protein
MKTIVNLIVFLFAFSVVAHAQPFALRLGDIVLTRNVDAVGNPNGYFNHTAIVTETSFGLAIVEMQQDFNTAIMVTSDAFFFRYPEYCIIRHKNSFIADRAGRFSVTQVGIPKYRPLASLKPCLLIGNGDNCVSFVRRCYVFAGKLDPHWIKPDNIYRFCKVSGFCVVAHFRYADYEVPNHFYEGLLMP